VLKPVTYRSLSSRYAASCVCVVAGVLALAGICYAQWIRDREAHVAASPPLKVDQLIVNDLAEFTANGYWNTSEVVIGQTAGSVITQNEGVFVSYSPSGGCVGGGCNDNLELHDASTNFSMNAGPQEQWFVVDGLGVTTQSLGAVVKVAKSNATFLDTGATYRIYTRPSGGGAVQMALELDNALHVTYAPGNPVGSPTSCGTGPFAGGADAFGGATTGTGATACTIPWAIPYTTTAPTCSVSSSNGATISGWAEALSGLTVTFAASGQWSIRWQCANGS
jgi:hypothetical protein